MELQNTLNIVEIVISVILIVTILLQQQGSGLGVMFGGAGGESYRSKRGVEKLLFNTTIVMLVSFITVGFAIALVSTK